MSYGFLSNSELKFDTGYTPSCDRFAGTSFELEIPLPQCSSDGKAVKVNLASTDGERQAACDLINRMYSWRGYGSDHRLQAGDTHTTFTVSRDGEVIGTLTLAVDSDQGLAVDRTFQSDINTFRRVPGARVCELTKLALDADCSSKRLLASLFHIIFIYGRRRYACTDLFIEVNPRHVRYYEAMLGFQRVGGLKTNESVGAPSQLMHLKVANIRNMIDEHTGFDNKFGQRSLYPFFLDAGEEAQVRARLMSVVGNNRAPARQAIRHSSHPS